jgi:hypothetical protein
VSVLAAWTLGMKVPASADTAATVPVVLMKSRRDVIKRGVVDMV